MLRQMPVVDHFSVKLSCDGTHYQIRFKAGKLGDDEHPGVCGLVLSQRFKQMLIEGGIIPEDVRSFSDLESLIKECSDIILDYEELSEEEASSGDCFCFLDQSREWRCLCEN